MQNLNEEICLAVIPVDDGYLSFTTKTTYLAFMKNSQTRPSDDADILLILKGGNSTIVKPSTINQMSWIMNQ